MDQQTDLSEKEPEVIRQQIEETRSSLTEKLETLECEVKQTIQGATSAVANTVETVKETVEGTVQSVKDTFNLKCHVEHHPWMMLGGAAALGYLVGSLMPRQDRVSRGMSQSQALQGNGQVRAEPASLGRPSAQDWGRPQPGFLGDVAARFAPEINQLKSLAIGTALGVAWDMMKESIPDSLSPQLKNLINSFTAKLGGEPLSGPVLEPSRTEPGPSAPGL